MSRPVNFRSGRIQIPNTFVNEWRRRASEQDWHRVLCVKRYSATRSVKVFSVDMGFIEKLPISNLRSYQARWAAVCRTGSTVIYVRRTRICILCEDTSQRIARALHQVNRAAWLLFSWAGKHKCHRVGSPCPNTGVFDQVSILVMEHNQSLVRKDS